MMMVITNLRRALTSALHMLLKDDFDDDDDDGDNEPEAGTDIRTPHAPQGWVLEVARVALFQ